MLCAWHTCDMGYGVAVALDFSLEVIATDILGTLGKHIESVIAASIALGAYLLVPCRWHACWDFARKL